MEYLVMSVERVSVYLVKSEPPYIGVSAKGTVNSGGWSRGRLIPYTYVAEPADGIQDFSFVATGPFGAGGATQALVPEFPGSGGIHYAPWIKGARVHAATNSIESLLDPSAEPEEAEFANAPTGDDPWPFPWAGDSKS